MTDRQQESKSGAFVRGAGTVHDPDNKLWGPARWVAQMVQYLVAIIIVSKWHDTAKFRRIASGCMPNS